MKKSESDRSPNVSTLLRVLSAHYQGLLAAGADEALLKQYDQLLRFLRSRRGADMEGLLGANVGGAPSRPAARTLSDEQIAQLSLDELERIARDDHSSRKDLESIAIQRFSVPRGSMRSMSNKRMLVDKLRVLIRNERAHGTIGEVARAEGKRFSDNGQ